jgi:hypothetical protein
MATDERLRAVNGARRARPLCNLKKYLPPKQRSRNVLIDSRLFIWKPNENARDFHPEVDWMFSFPRTVTRLAVSCAVMSATTQGFDGPGKSVFGVYGQAKAGHDYIRVTSKSEDRIGVNLKLYYSDGHTCQLNKDGKWIGDHIAVVAEGLDESRPCRLNLFFQNHNVLLQDEGLQCAPVYCGTRGKLDNASLPKSSPDRK